VEKVRLKITEVLLSDIVMITKFHADGSQNFGTASTACVSLCLGMQSIMVYDQDSKKLRGRQVKEQLIVFSLLKPGVDVWRSATYVASNREEGTAVDPKTELSYARGIELVFESVPGTVLHLAALIHAKEADNVGYFALASSVITTGTMPACMSWDWDMDEEKRIETPEFYGYITKKPCA